MSPLQRLQSQVTWAVSFNLQFFHLGIPELDTSIRTRQLMAEHEVVTRELKLSLRRDYKVQKDKILAEREKLAILSDISF